VGRVTLKAYGHGKPAAGPADSRGETRNGAVVRHRIYSRPMRWLASTNR